MANPVTERELLAGAVSIVTLLSPANAKKFATLSSYSASENILAAVQQVLENQAIINSKLDALLKGEQTMAATFADIQAAVTANTSAEASVVVVLNNISAQLVAALAAGGTPAQIQAVIDQVNANTAAAAAAVVANTPAAPTS